MIPTGRVRGCWGFSDGTCTVERKIGVSVGGGGEVVDDGIHVHSECCMG